MRGGARAAGQSEDLSRFFVERANAGDVEQLVALYESDAALMRCSGSRPVWSWAERPTVPGRRISARVRRLHGIKAAQEIYPELGAAEIEGAAAVGDDLFSST